MLPAGTHLHEDAVSTREMYDEVAALLGTIAKAFDLSDADAAKAVEEGRVTVELAADDAGARYVRVSMAGRAARLYPGAILHESESPEEEAEESHGCTCGKD